MRSIEPSGGSVLEGTTSGCDAGDVGSCCHCGRRPVGTLLTLEGVWTGQSDYNGADEANRTGGRACVDDGNLDRADGR